MMPLMENSILTAQFALFDELRNVIGHTREDATAIVQRVAAAELFGPDGLVDGESVARAAHRFPVIGGPAPDDKAAALTALVLAHAVITGDVEIPRDMMPTCLAEFRTQVAACSGLTSTVLSILAPGREMELLQELHQVELTAMATGAE